MKLLWHDFQTLKSASNKPLEFFFVIFENLLLQIKGILLLVFEFMNAILYFSSIYVMKLEIYIFAPSRE